MRARDYVIEYFTRRKQECEEDLRYAETTPGFRLYPDIGEMRRHVAHSRLKYQYPPVG